MPGEEVRPGKERARDGWRDGGEREGGGVAADAGPRGVPRDVHGAGAVAGGGWNSRHRRSWTMNDESQNHAAGDLNVERLVREAYRPEMASAQFVERVGRAM